MTVSERLLTRKLSKKYPSEKTSAANGQYGLILRVSGAPNLVISSMRETERVAGSEF